MLMLHLVQRVLRKHGQVSARGEERSIKASQSGDLSKEDIGSKDIISIIRKRSFR